VALLQRKKLLEANLKTGEHVRLVDYYEEDGISLFETAVNLGFEGLWPSSRTVLMNPAAAPKTGSR